MKKILASAAVLSALAGLAAADGTIISPGGSIGVGINAGGSIYTPTSGVGFQRFADGYDPINPGTPTEGWALSLDGTNARGDDYFAGSVNIALNSETYFASSAVIEHTVNGGQATVSQRYSFFAENVVGIAVTVTNTSGGTINSARYNREVDWDIQPSLFSEFVRVDPLGGEVVDSSYYGFEDRDANTPFNSFGGVGGGFYGLGDLGAGMTIDLIQANGGPLNDGDSYTFFVFHAISTDTQSENGLRTQLTNLGADWIATGVSSLGTGPTGFHAAMGYAFSFVPAPSSLALLGVAGLVARRRR